MTGEKKQVPKWASALRTLSVILSQKFLGGPRFVKLSWVINFQKGGTLPFVLALMWYFEHESVQAYVYLALHGTYGLCWLLKDTLFPDPNWEHKVTFGGAMMSFLLVLGPYWTFPYLLVSGVLGDSQVTAPLPLLAFAICLHTLGVVIMMVADCQKYYTLKYKKGLIQEGLFRKIRHPNYLGEMMLYGAYALIVQHWIPWAILAWVWISIFLVNMVHKEVSMSRYAQWAEYKKQSGMLLPKLF